ncbi:hypothetical protein [Brachyspira catarrhinii]|uniref:Outer membrane protein beta-barrel domain-containing protein n=1 Tax=Brachyspira catarrhinii TaxID=2528966 RepID=A0ABY2TRU8_9SPIR|nr:hypothetical protein [Brachyspira catarrhinii]TKZ35476.1 hypothetical protein EZH24_05070 [Brachyspira catarrhinii]
MRLKIFIIVSFLAVSSALFPAFEFELLPKLGFADSWTDLTKEVFEPRVNINLQIGYEFPINRGIFRGFGVLFDFGIDANTLSIANPNENYKINQIDAGGIYTGLAFKFVLNENPSSIVDLAFGVASGVKFIPIIDDLNIKPNKVPFSPYVRLFLEDRIYTTEKIAVVVGLDIFYEYMFFDKSDRNRLFAGYNINQHHSVGANFTIGLRFGKR